VKNLNGELGHSQFIVHNHHWDRDFLAISDELKFVADSLIRRMEIGTTLNLSDI